jgi:hypothetical protein
MEKKYLTRALMTFEDLETFIQNREQEDETIPPVPVCNCTEWL